MQKHIITIVVTLTTGLLKELVHFSFMLNISFLCYIYLPGIRETTSETQFLANLSTIITIHFLIYISLISLVFPAVGYVSPLYRAVYAVYILWKKE
jgi:hypothetical protein